MKSMYLKLGVALAISYVVMWLMSFTMIRQWDHWEPSVGNAYMALIMVAPMGVIMLGVMWRMYENKPLNLLLGAAFVLLWVVALTMGRTQTFVGDAGFLNSMIPHHSRAILMCQEADITDVQIRDLCDAIVAAQRQEIEVMQGIKRDLGTR